MTARDSTSPARSGYPRRSHTSLTRIWKSACPAISTTQPTNLTFTGDFYVIDPGVAHVQKSAAGTRILFVKHPAGDDKTPVAADAELSAWLDDLDF